MECVASAEAPGSPAMKIRKVEDGGSDHVEELPVKPGLEEVVPPKRVLTKRQEVRKQLEKKSKQKSKKQRFASFAGWLEGCIGLERLNSKLGVLDVAGGKGALGVDLVGRGVQCTVVDTMRMRLSPFRTKQFFSQCAAIGRSGAAPDPVNVERRRKYGSLVEHLDPKLCSDPTRSAQVADVCDHDHGVPLFQAQRLFDEAFLADEGGPGGAFTEASVVVGLHADEATEPLVDACLAAGKPFATVPCCVFPDANPHRRLQDGRAVRTVEDFIQYLVEKRPDVVRTEALEGMGPQGTRNVVVYGFLPPISETVAEVLPGNNETEALPQSVAAAGSVSE